MPLADRQSTRRAVGLLGAALLALALCLMVGLDGADGAKKKKKKAPSVFKESRAVNAAIPDDAPAAGVSVPVSTSFTVGKKFKGRVVKDVNVLGIQTTGNVADAADDLVAHLTAPSGLTIRLFANLGDTVQSLGPLTLDDDTNVSVCDGTPPCDDPMQSLNRPFAGRANMRGMASGGTAPLSAFDGTRMKGVWTLQIHDEANAGQTSVINGWGLEIRAKRP
jgi:hypothetical protein